MKATVTFPLLFLFCTVGLSRALSSNRPRTNYYTYKTFKRLNVPALVYSVASNLAHRIVGRRALEVPSSTTSSLRVAIVTGSNTGVGFETAKSLVQNHGMHVILACRDEAKGLQACETINDAAGGGGGKALFVQPLDLSDLQSVRCFGAAIHSQYEHIKIDVLINNAGRNSAGTPTAPACCTDDVPQQELDVLFTTNFLGHFLLTRLLLDKCRCVVNLSSVMHHFPTYSNEERYGNIESEDFWRNMAMVPSLSSNEDDVDAVRKTYAPSKLAALLFSVELNRRYGTTGKFRAVAVNPGSVASDIWRNYSKPKRALFRRVYLTPEQGSTTTVAAAILDSIGDDDNSEHNAIYLQPYAIPFYRGGKPPFPLFEMLGPYRGYQATTPRLPADGGQLAAKCLFSVCEKLVGCRFPERMEEPTIPGAARGADNS